MRRWQRGGPDLVFCLPESLVDVVLGLPDSRDTVLVVPEAFLECGPQLAEQDGVGRLLVDLCAESEPGSTTEDGE